VFTKYIVINMVRKVALQKVVRKATGMAVKKEDKVQNEALQILTKKVDAMNKIVYSKVHMNMLAGGLPVTDVPLTASVANVVPQ